MKKQKKYIFNDAKALFEIIEKFSKEVFDSERINITDNISISSLAFKAFLTNYYDPKKTPIYIPNLKQHKKIKEAYFGGRVEVFKP